MAPTNKQFFIILLVLVLVFGFVAWAQSNPLEGYSILGFGTCSVQAPQGTLSARCVALAKNDGEDIFFAILDEEGEVATIIKRGKGDKPNEVIWSKGDITS